MHRQKLSFWYLENVQVDTYPDLVLGLNGFA